eukprot:1298895-Rhodomonas_salina.3
MGLTSTGSCSVQDSSSEFVLVEQASNCAHPPIGEAAPVLVRRLRLVAGFHTNMIHQYQQKTQLCSLFSTWEGTRSDGAISASRHPNQQGPWKGGAALPWSPFSTREAGRGKREREGCQNPAIEHCWITPSERVFKLCPPHCLHFSEAWRPGSVRSDDYWKSAGHKTVDSHLY